ncbi:hypothetical protein FRC19_009795 [Serendipita sp. 401]|nr:hypothetical protein FRC19_009795 [Serendipita sp. 401]
MSSCGEDDGKTFMYLHHLTVDAPIKAEYRIKLIVDGADIRLTRKEQTSAWIPPMSLEVSHMSSVEVIFRTRRNVAGISFKREETVFKIDVQKAVQEFRNTMDREVSVSEEGNYAQQSAGITAYFRLSPKSESIRSELQRLQEEMIGFRHKINDAAQKHVDTVIKYGVAFSELDPRSKAAFSILRTTFELLKEQQKRDQMISSLASHLGRILPFAFKGLEQAVEDNADILRRTIERLYVLAVDVAEFAYDYIKRDRFKRLAKSIISTRDQQIISELTSSFEEMVIDFERAINIETLKAVRNLEETLLLNRLQPIQAGHSLDHQCMEGTRVSLLDEILDWALLPYANHPALRNIYWLYGIPGVGKTAVAHSICARLHKHGRLGGSFFCQRDDPKLSDPKNILPTLICKLAETWGGYRRLVAGKLRSDPHLNHSSAGDELLLQLLESLQNHPPYTLVLVIDAFDECGDIQGRNSILSTLFDACSKITWLRIFISSRQEQDIDSFFKRPNCTGRYFSTDLLNEDKTHDDIHLFAKRKLSLIAGEYDLPDDWPGSEKLELIVKRSGGLFIFVETLWRLLQEGLDPHQRLEKALSGGSRDVLDGLYHLYSTIINVQIRQEKETFRLAMGTIMAVGQYHPLPDKSIAQLAGLPTRIVTALVKKLGSLLYRDASLNGGIRVRHLSIVDFLTGPGSPEDLAIDFDQANRDIGVACLRTMIQGLKFNICDLVSSFIPNRDIDDLSSRIKEKMSDLLQYSCLYWSNHLCHSPDIRNEAIYSVLDSFTEGCRLLYWIEVLSLLEKVPSGQATLRRITSWVKAPQMTFVTHFKDALRFLLMFRAAIITSTPHIYVSGLPFTPTDTNLWRNAKASYKHMLEVERGRMSVWPVFPEALRGHTAHITSVAYSPDGRHIASGSYDKTIRLWDAVTGDAVGEPLGGHLKSILSIAYSKDGRHIVSGSYDKTLRIWDAETGEAVGEPLRGHTASVLSVAYSPDGCYIVSGSYDDMVWVWNADTRFGVGLSKRHANSVTSVTYSPDGRRIASGSADTTICIWNAETGDAIGRRLRGHTGFIVGIAYSPDGRRIVSGSYDNTVRIWNVETGDAISESLRGHTAFVLSIAYSPDGRHIVSGSADKTIRTWDAETGEAIGEPLRGHAGSVLSVRYSPDGRHIVSGSYDRTVRIWNAETRDGVGEPFRKHIDSILCVAYSPDGRRIVTGSADRTIRIWDTETGEAVGEPLNGVRGSILSIAYSPDGRHIVSGSADNTIQMWDAVTGDAVGERLSRHTDSILCIAYSPDGRHFVSGSADRMIRIWNVDVGDAFGEPLRGHEDSVTSVAYSSDGRHIVSGSIDQTIRIWDIETRKAVHTPLTGHAGPISSVAYSPDGRHIVCGRRNTIQVWNVDTEDVVCEMSCGNRGSILNIAYSPDGHHVASGSADGTIQIWDATTGDAIGEPLSGHTGPITSIVYSPDGRQIVSGSADQTTRVWDSAVLRAPPFFCVPTRLAGFITEKAVSGFGSQKFIEKDLPVPQFLLSPPMVMIDLSMWASMDLVSEHRGPKLR